GIVNVPNVLGGPLNHTDGRDCAIAVGQSSCRMQSSFASPLRQRLRVAIFFRQPSIIFYNGFDARTCPHHARPAPHFVAASLAHTQGRPFRRGGVEVDDPPHDLAILVLAPTRGSPRLRISGVAIDRGPNPPRLASQPVRPVPGTRNLFKKYDLPRARF